MSGSETKNALMELLQAQQSAIEKSGERWKFLEAMLKVQADAEKSHQDFMVTVLGKQKFNNRSIIVNVAVFIGLVLI